MGILCLFFFLICSEQGLLFVVLHGVSLRGLLLWAQALGAWASVAAAHRLSSCVSWALGHEASGAVVPGLRSCGSWALGYKASGVVVRGLRSCGSWALGHEASGAVVPGLLAVARGSRTRCSAVVACRLRCSEAREVFLDQGSNPCPPHW